MRVSPAWFLAIETLGVISIAVNAMIMAKAKGLSLLGVFVCALAGAFGGGTFRDLLLGPSAQPFFWIAHPLYVLAIFCVAVGYAQLVWVRNLVTVRIPLIKEGAEAISFASLGMLGTAKAYDILSLKAWEGPFAGAQLWILCALFAVIAGAFGTVIRDILLNDPPEAFRPGMWILEALFIGASTLVALRFLGVVDPVALSLSFFVTLILRIIAIIRQNRGAA